MPIPNRHVDPLWPLWAAFDVIAAACGEDSSLLNQCMVEVSTSQS